MNPPPATGNGGNQRAQDLDSSMNASQPQAVGSHWKRQPLGSRGRRIVVANELRTCKHKFTQPVQSLIATFDGKVLLDRHVA